MEIAFHKPYITEDEVEQVVDTVRSGWLTMGPKTILFEREFCQYTGAPEAVAVNSGTSALHLALKAAGVKAGDEVIVPTMTFTATAEVVCYFGATPVLVDIERDTHNMDASLIEKALTPRTRAIMPVHYGGQPCDMRAIMEIARSKNLFVIEDAAHSLPAWYDGKAVGTIGDLTCFSFYATKPLAAGEGGMVTTGNGDWAERIRVLRLHGISKDAWKRYTAGGSWYYEVIEAGYKYNMTDLQAALGLSQLRKLDFMWARRKHISERYTEGFADSEALTPPTLRPERVSSYHLYPIKINPEVLSIDRARFIEELRKRGVGASVHFIPLHRHPFYRNTFSCDAKEFPAAEWVYERLISLPIYPGMSDGEIEYVIDSVTDVSAKYKK
jgi:dTDP-4-amino-4,6-dideoxygalactose transaminase